jgi:PAS domain S-box-containing protein
MTKFSLSPRSHPSGPKAFAFTLATTILAALLSVALAPIIYTTPFMLVSGAVLVSAWVGGAKHGLLSAVLAAPFVNYYLMPPLRAWSYKPGDLLRTALWLLFISLAAVIFGTVRESESHARRVLANIEEGFCVLDYDWNFLYINSYGAKLAGCTKEQIVGQNLWQIFPEAQHTTAEQQHRRFTTRHVNAKFETCFPARGAWLRMHAHPLPDGICVFLQDITEARQNEEKLRSVLDRLAVAHKAAQMGTWDWNIKTNELIWSDEIPRIHGLTPEEFDGKLETWLKTIHPEDLERVQSRIQHSLETKEEYHIEFRVLFPNGDVRWVSGHAQVIVDEQGAPVRMVGIGADATHRHREEEALRRSEKLAAAERLAATMAHEINNPLEAVTNLIYLMRRDGRMTEETRQLLRMADEQLARVNHSARQALGFYRDRALAETVDVGQLFEELLAIFQSRLSARDIHVEKEFGDAATLPALKGELRQVLSCLLSNAIDASGTGSRLALRVKRETPRNVQSPASIRIEVEDFGTGIRPGDQARIFEPFFTTKSDVGTGLGLWMSRQIVEKHGGSIAFRTNVEKGRSGTCFSVVLAVNQTLRGTESQHSTAPPGVPALSAIVESARGGGEMSSAN